MRATVILGAGWSHVAGLPLTRDLMSLDPVAASEEAAQRFITVRESWQEWKKSNPGENAEAFFLDVYNSVLHYPPWSWVLQYLEAALGVAQDWGGGHNIRYANRIIKPSYCGDHRLFWRSVTSRYELSGVVTSNYDLLIERSLRHRPMRSGEPGFHYGGIRRPQVAKGQALPFSVSRQEREVALMGRVPLFKLHGSLNWASLNGQVMIYQDTRAAFRQRGAALIVPPLPEKEAPAWLRPIWTEAVEALAQSDTWIVCGHSLQEYDQALQSLFARAASMGRPNRVCILDPFADSVLNRWGVVVPRAHFDCYPGLPEALALPF